MAPAFVSAIPCSMHRAFGRQTCVRRPTVYACTQQFDANEGSNSWAQAGKTFELQQMQTIEFVIRPGGLVEETVTGVKGEACEKLTEDIELALGKVTHTEKTGEFYDRVTENVEENVFDGDGNMTAQW